VHRFLKSLSRQDLEGDPGLIWERLIIDLAPNGILLMAPDGTIVLANKQTSKMFSFI